MIWIGLAVLVEGGRCILQGRTWHRLEWGELRCKEGNGKSSAWGKLLAAAKEIFGTGLQSKGHIGIHLWGRKIK